MVFHLSPGGMDYIFILSRRRLFFPGCQEEIR